MWQLEIENDSRIVDFEAELWFRNDQAKRQQAEANVRSIVEDLDGEIIRQCVYPRNSLSRGFGSDSSVSRSRP